MFSFPVETILFLIFFISIWLTALFLMAKFSGWDKLAAKYGDRQPFQGKIFHFCSAYVGLVRYKSTMNIGVSTTGLYLSPFALFRLNYPPVLIPWSELNSFEEKKMWLMKFYVFNVGYPKITTIKLPSKVFSLHPEILEKLLRQP